MSIITKEQLSNLNEGDFVSGYIFIIDYALTIKEKTSFVSGKMKSIDGEMNFITFRNQGAFDTFQEYNFRGKVCCVNGTVNKFNGIGMQITLIEETDDYTADDFEESKYDKNELMKNFEELLERNVSSKGMEILDLLLFQNEIYEKFCNGYAASSFHDNCKYGLLAHTYKMLQYLEFTTIIYSDIFNFKDKNPEDIKDLIFIGATLHDIGKSNEMKNGIYQPDSIITHRTIGVLHVNSAETTIVNKYDKEWYYELITIINQHHDEYGEHAQTLGAYIVHIIDDFEAQMTTIQTKIQNETANNAVGNFIEITGDNFTKRKLYL